MQVLHRTGFQLLALMVLSGCQTVPIPAPADSAVWRNPAVRVLFEDLRQQMVVIPAGRFQRGSTEGLAEDEEPVRTVAVRSFLLSRYEVSAAQFAIYERAAGRSSGGFNPSGRVHPATNISWDDAAAFIGWLNTLGNLRFRLPTEAEWEYAARGGSAARYWWGEEFIEGRVNGAGTGGADVWAETAPVGSLLPNAFGLYNVLGNVWEWTADCYQPDYVSSPNDGSARSGDVTCGRVLRGGSWSDTPLWLRTATRNWFDRTDRFDYVGIRLAADLPAPTSGEK